MYLFELTLSLLSPCAQHTAPDGTTAHHTGKETFMANMERLWKSVNGSLDHALASTVVAQHHLWLTLANRPEQDRNCFLSVLIPPSKLFGEGLNAFQAQFED
ncbi:histone -like protein [Labeo rohita]|uniref:Histone-like protein n=1 Tax=Labeo rohita TaxID=84645 RepID=A0A498M918_LABRO|nr:histone -like protein [Labeo rohita]